MVTAQEGFKRDWGNAALQARVATSTTKPETPERFVHAALSISFLASPILLKL